MTPVVLISGGLSFVVGALALRPFSTASGGQLNRGGHLNLRAQTSDEVRRRELLRQLRDLDDDLAAGKLTDADHTGLRAPVEREAAAVLRRINAHGRATGTGGVTSGAGSGSVTSRQPRDRDAGPAGRWRHRAVMLLALAGGMAIATVLLLGAVSPRSAGHTISGGSAGAAMPASGPSSGASASSSGRPSPTRGQLASIDAAMARVKQSPRDVSAHLALADAYAAGGASQLAAVEYLVVTRLDPANAQANTSLALLAFEVGRTAQAKTMVDRVLRADPDQPEALYIRGLILLMGLRQPRAAERDLNAYLAVAPFGSHRTAAVTLLALASSQGQR